MSSAESQLFNNNEFRSITPSVNFRKILSRLLFVQLSWEVWAVTDWSRKGINLHVTGTGRAPWWLERQLMLSSAGMHQVSALGGWQPALLESTWNQRVRTISSKVSRTQRSLNLDKRTPRRREMHRKKTTLSLYNVTRIRIVKRLKWKENAQLK